MSTIETLRTESGDFQVRIMVDEHPVNPREDFDHIVHVITADDHRHWLPVDDGDGGPLQAAWDQISWRPDAIDVFTRYARIFHGAAVAENYDPVSGPYTIWYLTAADVEEHGVGDPQAYVEAERDEYVAYANGEVYGFVVEERVVWERAVKTGDSAKDWSWGFEPTDDSLWGIYGFDWAQSMAKDAIAALEPEPAQSA
ncbi:hypothetical protein KGG70_gp16 [Streptomyces phage Celia]|uniref:Uncharacterized protein n=1 Tax=Streptomyces phage Celia TaxID=2590946 RepID=A0A516KRE7_9CAUD|nr:hypothetical protein KGG70_gp16 [Streptomyces phage Celia]QDP44268.1 hypothetical protein SEA_CELIA_65 [Streptomyces phage Celia]QFG10530.1 hypothetical protein SEA_URZA_67 [Streptomyces phage Urza]QJD50633.1 hypothetical protein SEA_ITZA_68 [Streptomyces phage Itza]